MDDLELISGLLKSTYTSKKKNFPKIIHTLNSISTEPWAAADYRIRIFFNELYKTRGIEICQELCAYTEGYPFLKTILYSMLGHRYFDCGNIEAMRKAYNISLKTTNKIPEMAIHTNADKWKFSTYFYWARHDPDVVIKRVCLEEAIRIPTNNFHRELIITKFIRALQWLIKNTNSPCIEIGKKSLLEFLKDGRISNEEYRKIDIFPEFKDAKPGMHDFTIGNP